MKKTCTFLLFIVCSVVAHGQIITTIVGDSTNILGDGGLALLCELNNPYRTAMDNAGNLYIADQRNHRIRKVDGAGIINTIAGTGVAGYSGDDSAATNAKLNWPSGVAIDATGNIYIGDNFNHRIRKVNIAGIITTVAGTGAAGYNGDNIPATDATLYGPHGVSVDGSGNIYICDGLNYRVRKVDAVTGIITTVAGNNSGAFALGGMATATNIGEPYGAAIDEAGNVYYGDVDRNLVCKVDVAGILTAVAGTGHNGYNGDNIAATTAELYEPFDVALDGGGNLYIADLYNNRIRMVNPAGIITTVAGNGTIGYSGDNGQATAAQLYYPVGITINNSGNMYIADFGNERIRFVRNTVGVNTVNSTDEAVHIYPNPSTGTFTFLYSSAGNENVGIIITNVLGEKIAKMNGRCNTPMEVCINAAKGIYFITATSDNKKITSKIMIE